MNFKTPLIALEFRSDDFDPRCRAIIREIDDQCFRKFNYNLTVTDVLREQNEEEKLNPKVKRSPHVERPSRAADIRTKDMSPEILLFVGNLITFWWPECKLLRDDRGETSPHFHFHVPKRKEA